MDVPGPGYYESVKLKF